MIKNQNDEYFDEAMLARIDKALKSVDEGRCISVTLDELRAMANAMPSKKPRKNK